MRIEESSSLGKVVFEEEPLSSHSSKEVEVREEQQSKSTCY